MIRLPSSLKAEQADIRHYRAEARFIRALAYYHALDLFRNIPFVTENDPVGSFLPPRYTGTQVFEYIESELKDIDTDLLDRQEQHVLLMLISGQVLKMSRL